MADFHGLQLLKCEYLQLLLILCNLNHYLLNVFLLIWLESRRGNRLFKGIVEHFREYVVSLPCYV